MSGICGIVRMDGGAAATAAVDAMLRVMQHRGPDGLRSHGEDMVAMGHAALATTPQALGETLPLADRHSGCTITADVRLDNRESLLAALAPHAPSHEAGDGELVLRAYLRWGERCLDRLLGDFAFAIWDAPRKRLFCARDPVGMRQFAWHCDPGRQFAFATDPAAILALPGCAPALNRQRIADFLVDLEGADPQATFHEGIFRLPAGHCLTLAEGEVAVRRYWSPPLPPLLRLPSDAAYEAAFRAVLEEAVRARLRSVQPVAAMLSGGLDSTSVSAIAARLLGADGNGPLTTISIAGPDPAVCPETTAIHAARAIAGIAHRIVDHTVPDNADDLVSRLERADDPFDGHMVLIWAAYREAARCGANVLLDGVGADIVLADGGHVPALVRRGKWRRALGELRARKRMQGPAGRSLVNAALRVWGAALLPQGIVRFLRGLAASLPRAVDPGFARKLGLRSRIAKFHRELAGPRLTPQARRARGIVHPHLAVARERYERVAARFGIEPRDPFLDLRVIEFCLSLPPEQLLRAGWPKWILRRAMADFLPDAVLWRRGRSHLGREFARGLLSGPVAEWLSGPAAREEALRPFVRREWLERGLSADEGRMHAQLELWHLRNWLRRQG